MHKSIMSETMSSPTPHLYTGREKEYKREWYLKNRERMAASAKKRYRLKRVEILAHMKSKPVSPEEKLRRKEYMAKWHKANKAKVLIYRNRRADNGKRDEYHARWRKKNKGKVNAHWHRYRALRRAATVNLKGITKWMQDVKSKKTSICYYCKSSVNTDSIHFDHIIPISNGGPHSIENLCVSCQPCNNRKHAKSVKAFVVIGQQILGL